MEATARIVDSHCHASPEWQDPLLPVHVRNHGWEQLRFQVDSAGVDIAVVVSGGASSAYVFDRARDEGVDGRFILFPSVESYFSSDYRSGNAAGRLRSELERFRPRGFNHYEADWDDGSWFTGREGIEYFTVAAEWNQIVSIHVRPHHLRPLRRVAKMFPCTPFLVHHMGFPISSIDGKLIDLREILSCGDVGNIHVKVSGFDIGSSRPWDYPYEAINSVFRDYLSAFGAERMHWGSNFPMCSPSMTYRQSLECVREHAPVSSKRDLDLILGESLARLLDMSGPSAPAGRVEPDLGQTP